MANFLISELFNRNYLGFCFKSSQEKFSIRFKLCHQSHQPASKQSCSPFQRETASLDSHGAFAPLPCEVVLHVRASAAVCFSSQEQMAGHPINTENSWDKSSALNQVRFLELQDKHLTQVLNHMRQRAKLDTLVPFSSSAHCSSLEIELITFSRCAN